MASYINTVMRSDRICDSRLATASGELTKCILGEVAEDVFAKWQIVLTPKLHVSFWNHSMKILRFGQRLLRVT
jgi:hypothetical protein